MQTLFENKHENSFSYKWLRVGKYELGLLHNYSII